MDKRKKFKKNVKKVLTNSLLINIMLITTGDSCKKLKVVINNLLERGIKMNNIKNFKVYKRCLIVVDMVNGFVREGVLHDPLIAEVIPRQIELLEENKKLGGLTIFIKDTHEKNATEFHRFGDTTHCLKGTKEAEVVDELRGWEMQDNAISIEKNSTSYMEAPEFREVIKQLEGLEEVHVVGCCTDICDFNGSMGLANYFDQWNKNIPIYVHQDAVATYSEDARQDYVKAAYLLMEQQGIQLVKKK